MSHMKYKVRKEFRKYRWMPVPMHPVLLKISNRVMPVIQKSDNRYGDALETETVSFSHCTGELVQPNNKKNVSCLVYLHGGGFVLKASKAHKDLAREYAYRGEMAVLSVDYRLAPVHPYPLPLEDCYEAYLWASERYEKVFVGGDSAGGNLALAVTGKAIEEKKRIPEKLLLVYPVTDSRMQTSSMNRYTDAPLWNAKLNRKMWKLYCREEDLHNRFVSPLETENFSSFPDSYIETAEFDCLRDEGIQLAERMKQDGIPVELHNTQGTIHGYDQENRSEYVGKYVEKRIRFLKEDKNK